MRAPVAVWQAHGVLAAHLEQYQRLLYHRCLTKASCQTDGSFEEDQSK